MLSHAGLTCCSHPSRISWNWFLFRSCCCWRWRQSRVRRCCSCCCCRCCCIWSWVRTCCCWCCCCRSWVGVDVWISCWSCCCCGCCCCCWKLCRIWSWSWIVDLVDRLLSNKNLKGKWHLLKLWWQSLNKDNWTIKVFQKYWNNWSSLHFYCGIIQ